jgi:signal transduction histidine kinase
VLGAVVKELANPVAAAGAAAKLLAAEPDPDRARIHEALQRSVVRVERAFRRVARLARAGEERPRVAVLLSALVDREVAVLRREVEQGGHTLLATAGIVPAVVRADPDDLSLLLQLLVDAARVVAPVATAITVGLARGPAGTIELSVADRGAMPARERRGLTDLSAGTQTAAAAPVLAWGLSARIAADHRARMEMRDRPDGTVAAVVEFEPGE